MKEIHHWIDGKEYKGTSGRFSDVFNPATGEVQARLSLATKAELDRIKKIFTSIEDSGVSHLKRTLAKEGLEALHYRVLYSVRSKPQPRRVGFQVELNENKSNKITKYTRRVPKEENPEASVMDEGKPS